MLDRQDASDRLTARYLKDSLAHIKGRVPARTY